MSELIIKVRAPSNIALIKYMGKSDSSQNIPENPSLSLTLDSLCTCVELVVRTSRGSSTQPTFRWVPELPNWPRWSEQLVLPRFKEPDQARVLRHFERVKQKAPDIFSQFGLEYLFQKESDSAAVFLKTGNTFPASSGVASSASSFAGMTLAFAAACAQDISAFYRVWKEDIRFRRCLAQVSRMGSGSSCRSFEGPWVFWEQQESFAFSTQAMPALSHFVVLIQSEPKQVSSSEAHAWVQTSPLWEGRVSRVAKRMSLVQQALQKGDFSSLAKAVWSEMWEMHSLFHTCAEPFTYWAPGTVKGLVELGKWIRSEDPPLVTLDAGPNIHIIVKKSQQIEWRDRLLKYFPGAPVLEDEPGKGVDFV